MELSDVIRKRRSVRKFDPAGEVRDDQIKMIIEAGILAPSSGNTQCWRFIVVRDTDLKNKLAKDVGHQPFISEAPVVIVVCADLERSAKYGERGVNTYSLQDTAAAIENMLLTITDLGLASCWIGAFDEDAAAKFLGLSKHIRPVAMLPVGRAADTPKMPRRKPIDDVSEWR